MGMMPELDCILKDYWSNNEQFADLFNAVLFHGRQVIKPEKLEELDREESAFVEYEEYDEILQTTEDMIKVQKLCSGQCFQIVILGLDNQEKIHYEIPMQVTGYDYACYKEQYENNEDYKIANQYEKDLLKTENKFVPVITIVLYCGEEEWNGLIPFDKLINAPEGMERYVNNYKIVRVDVKENNLLLHNVNNQDLFNLLYIVLNRNLPRNEAKEKAIRYSEKNKIDKSVVMTVASAMNMKLDYSVFEERDDAVSILFEELAKERRTDRLKKNDSYLYLKEFMLQ